MDIYNLVSLSGIPVLLGFAWLFSTDRRRMNWRAIGWGVALQMLFGLFIFRVGIGTTILSKASDAAVAVMGCAAQGTEFIFGPLAHGPGTPDTLGFILITQALPTIVFFSALMAALYYVGVMPWIIRLFSKVFTRLMRVSGAESLCAASNIFVGVESATTVRPYLAKMTRSELCTVLTAGMSTVASTVLFVYTITLSRQFPGIAGHLISASLLSAPAAIMASKILVPETDAPETLGVDATVHYEREDSMFEAIINGSMTGMRLLMGIVALLLAVQGLAALADLLLGCIGDPLNARLGWGIDWTLTGLLGYLFCPFALVIGVPPDDAVAVAKLLGERAVLTELTAYQSLATLLAEGGLHHPRSTVIVTYALCGFAHIASVAIFVGGVAAIVPERTRELAQVGFRALVAATLACLLTACVAGAFFSERAMLLGG